MFIVIVVISISFNYEDKSSYSDLEVIAADNGVNSRDSQPSSITVNINNLNDNSPSFDENTFSKYLISNLICLQ